MKIPEEVRAMNEKLSNRKRLGLEQRLVMLKRLMGLKAVRFGVLVDENDSIVVIGSSFDDESPTSDSLTDQKQKINVPTLHFGSKAYEIPELLDPEPDAVDYFG